MGRGVDVTLSALRRRQGQEFSFFRHYYFAHQHPDAEFHQALCHFLSTLKMSRGVKALSANMYETLVLWNLE